MRKQDPVQRSSNFIKGKLGENIIMRLLRDLDFQVFPNGYEVTHPALITLMNRKQIDGKQIKKYRMRADLTVLKEANDKQKSLCFEAEVKFRFSGNIEKRELQEYDNDVRFIFVDEKNFWSASKDDIFKPKSDVTSKLVMFNTLSPLEEDKFFNFSSDQKVLIKRYKSLISQFLPTSQPRESPQAVKSKAEKKKSFPINHGKPWPLELIEKLIEEYSHLVIRYSSEEAIELLSLEFDRSPESIRMKLEKEIAKK